MDVYGPICPTGWPKARNHPRVSWDGFGLAPVTLCRVLGSRASDAVYTELLDVGLPDFVAKPCWTVSRCSDLLAPALEYVDAVGAALAKGDLGVAA